MSAFGPQAILPDSRYRETSTRTPFSGMFPLLPKLELTLTLAINATRDFWPIFSDIFSAGKAGTQQGEVLAISPPWGSLRCHVIIRAANTQI